MAQDGLCASCSASSSPRQIALSIAYSGRVAGREPTRRGHGADELGDLLDGPETRRDRAACAAVVQLQAFARQLVAFLAPYDALLTPALAERPLPLGTLDTARRDPMETFTRSGLFTPFTPVFNASGQPGISLPLYEGEDGLPLGVQLVGRAGRRGARCWRSRASSKARSPWAQRRAPVGEWVS